jgi:uncharacterized integral membrane protein
VAADSGGGVGPRLVVAALALAAGALFVAQNRQRIHVHFLFFTVSSRAWVGLLVCLLLGVLLGVTVGAWWTRRRAKH